MRNRHLLVLSAALFLAGVGLWLYKWQVLQFPIAPDTRTSVWNVEAKVSFEGSESSAKVALLVPNTTRRYLVTDENFISQGYGVAVGEEEGNRRATWSIRKAKGKQLLFYRAVIREADVGPKKPSTKPPDIVQPEYDEARFAAANAILSEARPKTADTESLVAELVRRVHLFQSDPNMGVLVGLRPKEQDKVRTVVQLLRLAGVPSRVVHGIQLVPRHQRIPVQVWFEVWEEGVWSAFDPLTGRKGIAADYFPWWRGDEPIATVTGGEKLDVQLSAVGRVEEALRHALVTGESAAPTMLRFSLFALPLQTQLIYRVILLIPIGALFVALCRNVVGITTFGTFLPVLVALSFRETQLLSGLVFFSIILALGLLVRFYLEQLKLLLVPRLAAILTVVILIMVAVSVVAHVLGFERGLSIALFPMVILSMMIERMSVLWDELGARAAFSQALGTLIVAALTYLIVASEYLEHLFFVFPELLLVVLSVTILLGRYSGYRFTELLRFQDLSRAA